MTTATPSLVICCYLFAYKVTLSLAKSYKGAIRRGHSVVYNVTTCDAMSYVVMSCHVISDHNMSCQFNSVQVRSGQGKPINDYVKRSDTFFYTNYITTNDMTL